MTPVMSRYARRRNSSSVARGEGVMPAADSFLAISASMRLAMAAASFVEGIGSGLKFGTEGSTTTGVRFAGDVAVGSATAGGGRSNFFFLFLNLAFLS